MTDEKEDPFGDVAHNRGCPAHSRKYGHYCLEWDGLWICFDCVEFDSCLCFRDELTEEEKKELKVREEKHLEWLKRNEPLDLE